jgi:SAM-dependent methyltransferase
MTTGQPDYLRPYLDAARRGGDGFAALLWASRRTQQVRFDVIRNAVPMHGRLVLDVGCGRADLLEHLQSHGIEPMDYLGLEAVPELAALAEKKQRPGVRILRGDFVRDPVRLFVGAEVVVFSGSLNTLDDGAFYQTLRRAWDATAWTLVFNFLCSDELAGAEHLHWRSRADVEAFARTLQPEMLRAVEGYLSGDCTMVLEKIDPQ